MSGSTVGAVFLSLTNVFFLVPFVEAIYKYRWTRAFVYLVLVFASGIYHACFSSMSLCLFDHGTHQDLDFFLSYLLVPLSALYFVDFTLKWAFVERWLILSFSLAIFITHTQVPFSEQTTVQYILVGVSLFIVLVYWVAYYEREGHLPPYNWGYVVLSILFVLGSFVFFIWPSILGYDASHSIWHTLAAFGQLFILRIRKTNPKARYAALDANINVFPQSVRPIPRVI